jgi:hypothetical protein
VFILERFSAAKNISVLLRRKYENMTRDYVTSFVILPFISSERNQSYTHPFHPPPPPQHLIDKYTHSSDIHPTAQGFLRSPGKFKKQIR